MSDEEHDRHVLQDRFDEPVRPGRVVGSRTSDGVVRLGLDPTRAMGIDHGALRIQSLRRSGWGTATLAYGERDLRGRIAFGAWLLNGHNTAQAEPLGEPLSTRFKRWMRGNEVEPWPVHVLRWLVHGRRRWTLLRFAHWVRVDRASRRGTLQLLDESLAVGFVGRLDGDPIGGGSSFVMHATGHDNGELWAVSAGRVLPVLAGVRNVPLYLVVASDGEDAVFYAASVDGVRGLPELPCVRPLAVLPRGDLEQAHPAVLQSVSGQIGFAADTRVWELLVAEVPAWLDGAGGPMFRVDEPSAGSWEVPQGVGLVQMRLRQHGDVALWLRGGSEPGSGWCLARRRSCWSLTRHDASGSDTVLSSFVMPEVTDTDTHDVQIRDDGQRLGISIDGTLPVGWIDDAREGEQARVHLEAEPGVVHRLLGYPRTAPLPGALRPVRYPARPGRVDPGTGPVLVDCLVDEFRTVGDLELPDREGLPWRRTTGAGRIIATDDGARVDATAECPLPGRVVYTVPSPDPALVEIEIDVKPPGTERGQSERGRAGVVFEQADGDALIVATWLDDVYGGASISSFFRLDGFEDLYDAIWSNVGSGVVWGRPYRLRVCFDGSTYDAYLDDELVIHRNLRDVHPHQRRLRIDRVGLVANWEWGTDTGSVFRRFVARTAPGGDVPR